MFASVLGSIGVVVALYWVYAGRCVSRVWRKEAFRATRPTRLASSDSDMKPGSVIEGDDKGITLTPEPLQWEQLALRAERVASEPKL